MPWGSSFTNLPGRPGIIQDLAFIWDPSFNQDPAFNWENTVMKI